MHQDKLHFLYDAQSCPAQVNFNGVLYTYIHNLQGDIVGLLDSTGVLVVEYKYDAWGKPISATGNLADTLGKRNPFRYRGYIYDEETGLYYLRSRYYNPTVGRFVNEDGVIIQGLLCDNLFAYCSNNPLSRVDASGYGWNEFWSGVGNWISNTVEGIQNSIKQQAEIRADVDRRLIRTIDNGISSAANWVKKKVSDVGEAVSGWWLDSAKPWLNQAYETACTIWNKATTYMQGSFYAAQQADIISVQMTYSAACNVGNWAVDNWKIAIDWVTGVAGVGSSIYGIVQTLIPTLPAIPVLVQGIIVGAGIWGLGRLANLY